MKIQRYKQKIPEGCLARSLLILLEKSNNIKINDKLELDLFNFALHFSRENFIMGHLEKFSKKFNQKVKWIVDTQVYYDFTKKLKLSKKINLEKQKINLETIDKLLPKPLIVYIDQFYLWNKKQNLYYKYHYPHFIVILKKQKKGYIILDPNDGEEKLISSKLLSQSVSELRNKLWFSPQIIQLK